MNPQALKSDVLFLVMQELAGICASPDQSQREQHVQNSVALLKNQRVQKFKDQYFLKALAVAQTFDQMQLGRALKEKYFLQKKGKVFGQTIVKECFITQDHFGKIEKDGEKKPLKIVQFKHQLAKVQGKKDVDSRTDLPWEETKEKTNYRVLFTEKADKKRQRAIYFKDLESARLVRDHTRAAALVTKPSVAALFKRLRDLQRLKSAERFLLREVRAFFQSGGPAMNRQVNQELQARLKDYVLLKFPQIA